MGICSGDSEQPVAGAATGEYARMHHIAECFLSQGRKNRESEQNTNSPLPRSTQ
jgi:hypothetical protein